MPIEIFRSVHCITDVKQELYGRQRGFAFQKHCTDNVVISTFRYWGLDSVLKILLICLLPPPIQGEVAKLKQLLIQSQKKRKELEQKLNIASKATLNHKNGKVLLQGGKRSINRSTCRNRSTFSLWLPTIEQLDL